MLPALGDDERQPISLHRGDAFQGEAHKYIENGEKVTLSFKKWKNAGNYRVIFDEFIVSKGLDLKKIKILSGLTYLNMAPLHPEPINRILIIYGALMISNGLEEK